MKAFFTSLIVSAIVAGGISSFALSHITTQSFGATSNAGANALYEQSLAQPLGTTDPNMYVTSGADVQGNLLPVNSYQCLSVDTGQPNFEAVCGNVTSSATSGLILNITLRGLSTQTATTSNASYIFTHRRGADVRITDFPSLTVLTNQLNGVQTIPNLLTYDTGVLINTLSPSSTIATKYYVDNVVVSGAPNASAIVKGIVQLATAAQAALGTILGSTGASLVLPASIATSTPYNSGLNVVPVTGTNEKLSQLFLDLTQAFTWTGAHTFNSATTTLNWNTVIAGSSAHPVEINGIYYMFPASQSSGSSILTNNGSGTLSWGAKAQYSLTSFVNLNGGTSTVPLTIPAGVLSASSTISVLLSGISCNQSAGNTCTWSLRDSGGTTLATCAVFVNFSGTANGFANMTVANQSSLSSQMGVSDCFLTNGSSVNVSSSGNTTTTFNTANALNLVMFDSQTGGGVGLGQYSIIVNP